MHSPYKRIVPGAENAVLFVHGIVSTPRMFDDFVALVPSDWSVHNVLLPGHGGSVQEFGQHSAREWISYIRQSLDELRQSQSRVYIVAHSLGTLLAIRQAVSDDSCIVGMLLLCVPLRIWVKPSAMLRNILKGVGLTKVDDLHTCYGITQDWRIWRYIRWIPRYLELFRESASARKSIMRVKVPSIVYMAERDELVSLRGVKLLKANSALNVRLLPESYHHEFPETDKATLLAAFRDMCGI